MEELNIKDILKGIEELRQSQKETDRILSEKLGETNRMLKNSLVVTGMFQRNTFIKVVKKQ